MATQAPAGGVELTQQEAEKRAEVAFQLNERVKDGLAAGREALWQVAEALYEFNEEAVWTALGYETLADWLADPDIGMTKSTYYRLTRMWRQLVIHRKITPAQIKLLEPSKVDIVLGAVEQGRVSVNKALADAKDMGARDLREVYMRPTTPEPGPEEADAQAAEEAKSVTLDDEPIPADQVGEDAWDDDDLEVEDAEEDPEEDDVEEEVEGEATGPPTDDGVEEAWLQVEDAIASRAQFPRIEARLLQILITAYRQS
jgi:hypothetical protein